MFRLLESLSEGAAQARYKAGSSYCVAADGAKISVHSTVLVLQTRQETSVRDAQGAEIFWQYTRGTLLTWLFLNTDFSRKNKNAAKLNRIVIPLVKHLQLTGVFPLVKLKCSEVA